MSQYGFKMIDIPLRDEFFVAIACSYRIGNLLKVSHVLLRHYFINLTCRALDVFVIRRFDALTDNLQVLLSSGVKVYTEVD